MPDKKLVIGGIEIAVGETKTIGVEVAKLYDSTDMSIPVRVFRGLKDGPILFVSAAIHGDEINGVEILRRLAHSKFITGLHGTLIVVPIVNVFGFNMRSRYLPDRRDLNRTFPGSSRGSLAARLADIFLREIVAKCTHGIDIHTGAVHRFNAPHVRANLKNAATKKLAFGFGSSLILQSSGPDGSLRHAATKYKIPVVVYEAGEALRFDEESIEMGYEGILRMMRSLHMIPAIKGKKKVKPFVAKSSHWIRAPQSGMLKRFVDIKSHVREGSVLGVITDPFGENEVPVLSPIAGVVVGTAMLPLANRGDALFHIATAQTRKSERVEPFNEDEVEPLSYEPNAYKPLRVGQTD